MTETVATTPVDPVGQDTGTTAELSAREIEQGQRLATVLFAFGKQQATIAARMSKAGVDRSAIVLLKYLVALGPSRSSALAEAIHSDPSTVSRQVATLVKDGLVERRADPEDGRASLLAVTEAGVDLLKRQRALMALSLAKMVSHWDHEDLDTFVRLFERFLADHADYLPTLITECATHARSEGGK
ncbi:MarR family winged helix-turn-helix transcriptional regulator [Actinokineospora globicatena]|uniref:MarR family winged helix-turn-helix transcriptional regulator n=1 Tax=Actinokineospora globicatena TaxID=103729 RepID=UPI0020A36E1A|nr:MarR family winged helix-turn-helix transcriptional regulator [Actinokineospora globicatena]MCP2300931.1 DNA-binding transcriptional regulator, MarR family [Actinokineospora globicatena]GLW77442.1 MarR family transcriptional regulator [Actinokineospora globicatena]GLW84276.1 MarR family transcriptional regulator [Actinokineospora globicatena]